MQEIKILMVTRLFPSGAFPALGTFCAERAKALARHAEVRVWAPTPYWPRHLSLDPWRRYANVESSRVTPEGVSVEYLRYLSLPAIATWTQGLFMAHRLQRHAARRAVEWSPHIIDAHFAFPDGYAAMVVSRRIGCPFVVTCHGSDLRLYPRLAFVGHMIRNTFEQAARVVAVSPALANQAVALGASPEKVATLPNGVDTELFHIRDKAGCRRKLGLPEDGPLAVCVGSLGPPKDQATLVRAWTLMRQSSSRLPNLYLVGDGPARNAITREILALGLPNYVHLVGAKPYTDMPYWMAAADYLLLSSHHEGWPTVYFEAMACGTPIVTSNVAAAKSALCDPRYGIVVESQSPEAFAAAVLEAQRRRFDAGVLRAYAEQHSWARWAERMLGLLHNAIGERLR